MGHNGYSRASTSLATLQTIFMHLLAHGPSGTILFGALYLISMPIALISALLLGWPDKRVLAGWLAWISLIMSSPVLLVAPLLPSMLGSDAYELIVILIVSPLISVLVLLTLRRWRKK